MRTETAIGFRASHELCSNFLFDAVKPHKNMYF